ncbi:unnamed protein product [Periconia digitata]|uniref:Uncharacterized protein n=1 Tax=Periconia digitata TaxID=1303443 RepID=A0A9W4XY97_9PLEO|nr:unnamed protein product [Periconia digitata]
MTIPISFLRHWTTFCGSTQRWTSLVIRDARTVHISTKKFYFATTSSVVLYVCSPDYKPGGEYKVFTESCLLRGQSCACPSSGNQRFTDACQIFFSRGCIHSWNKQKSRRSSTSDCYVSNSELGSATIRDDQRALTPGEEDMQGTRS